MLVAAGAAAGAINSLAGGGTLVSFPALLWLGRDPIVANATNTLALCPGALAAMAAFRNDLAPIRRWMLLLVPPSLAGGLIGALLLLRTPERVFEALVPWLILFATVLFAAQAPILAAVRRFRRHDVQPVARLDAPTVSAWPWVVGFEFLVAIYGGYFGAGIGIMTLAALGLVGFTDIHHMVGLRNFAALCINGIASIYFVAKGAVIWPDALTMMLGQIVGGYGGGYVARKLGRTFMRRAVVVIGVVMALSLLLARAR